MDKQEAASFGEITAERINIVDANGTVRLVITNGDRFPPPVIGGKTFERQGSMGGVRPTGIVFYNEHGDECGALTIGGRRSETGYDAGSALKFDMFQNDEILGLMYGDENGRRAYGLALWERPLPGEPNPGRSTFWSRIFLGRYYNGEPTLLLMDRGGRPRVQLRLDTVDDRPFLEFLDKEGRVTFRFSDDGPVAQGHKP